MSCVFYETSFDPKDPDEVVAYDLNWSPQLKDGDTITDSNWSVETGDVEIVTEANSDTMTKVKLSGGTVGTTCILKNTVTTVNQPELICRVMLDIRKR